MDKLSELTPEQRVKRDTNGEFIPESLRFMPYWKLHMYCLLTLIPALIVGLAKDFNALADEDTRRRKLSASRLED